MDEGSNHSVPKKYDCIVLGVGGVGSAALYFAAKQGWNVLGIDRFSPGHHRGSSHGTTRIIRQAYFEHPDYVPLVLDAYRLWDDFEKESGQNLFQRTGLLQVGNPEGPIIGGVQRCADEHGLPLRRFETEDLRRAYPLFNCREGDVGLFEEIAGFLRVEDCVSTFAKHAIQLGATIIDNATISEWRELSNDDFVVKTDQGDFCSSKLIISGGAWSHDLMPDLLLDLKVISKHQHWFRIDDPRCQLGEGCPTFFFETDEGYFYGFPGMDGDGNKVAEHSGGVAVPDPLNVDRELNTVDLQRVQNFVHEYFNAPRGVHSSHSVCMYTMSADEHFMIDTLPSNKRVAFACGLSGHGFKFTSLIGKSLVDMLEGQRRDDMDFLRVNRFNNALE